MEESVSSINLFPYLAVLIFFLWLGSGYLFLKKRRNRLSEESYKILESQERADEIIKKASLLSRDIIGRAEVEQNSLVSAFRMTITKAEEDYQNKMEEIFKIIKERTEGRITERESGYEQYLSNLETRLSGDLSARQKEIQEKTDAYFAHATSLLEKFIDTLQNRAQIEIDNEIGNAKKIIDEYRIKRLEVIDENIVAILEKALNVALGKKLALGDQTQLVFEALEQAKKENLFS